MTGEVYGNPNQDLVARIAELERENQRLRELAYTDALTGLGNLWALKEQIDNFVNDEQPFAVFYIDLKNFKTVNEVTGHEGGDSALKEAARLFDSTMRDSDTLVRTTPYAAPKAEQELGEEIVAARKGGDEFVLLLRLEPEDGKDNPADRRHARNVTEDNLNGINYRLSTKFNELPSVVAYNQHISPLGESLQLGLHINWAVYYPSDKQDFSLSTVLQAADPKHPRPQEAIPAPEDINAVNILRYIARLATDSDPSVVRRALIESSEPYRWEAGNPDAPSTKPGDKSIVEDT